MDFKKLRTTYKLTAKQLAAYLDIDEDTYNAIELKSKILTSDQLEKLEALFYNPEFFKTNRIFSVEELKAFANVNRIAMNQEQMDKIERKES